MAHRTSTSTRTARLASRRQIDYIASLVAERDTAAPNVPVFIDKAREQVMARTLTSAFASEVIELLQAQPRKASAPSRPQVEEGMYLLGDDIYKVQRAVHGSGHLYAKRLEMTDSGVLDGERLYPAKFTFNYAAGAMRLLRPEHKMTLEQAKEFGALYGTCCVCGRTLTNETSIEAGIGPVCAGRL